VGALQLGMDSATVDTSKGTTLSSVIRLVISNKEQLLAPKLGAVFLRQWRYV
jgi:hypothetical protein